MNIQSDDMSEAASEYIADPRNDPMFPTWSWAHLTRPENVGYSKPGLNTLTITPLENTDNPFRMVGIIICGACVESNHETSVKNIRLRVPGSDDSTIRWLSTERSFE